MRVELVPPELRRIGFDFQRLLNSLSIIYIELVPTSRLVYWGHIIGSGRKSDPAAFPGTDLDRASLSGLLRM